MEETVRAKARVKVKGKGREAAVARGWQHQQGCGYAGEESGWASKEADAGSKARDYENICSG